MVVGRNPDPRPFPLARPQGGIVFFCIGALMMGVFLVLIQDTLKGAAYDKSISIPLLAS